MLNSVLLHLEGSDQAEAVIRLGVAAARQTEARVRGMTLLDTRRSEAAHNCEAAVYAVMELGRQATTEREQEAVRLALSRACLDAGLNFDVRRLAGDPLQVLPREARFHDLVITSVAAGGAAPDESGDLSLFDVVKLVERGVEPLLVVQANQRTIDRVLMVYDGQPASGRAIRSFLSQHIFSDADHRLLAISNKPGAATTALREMADYCLARRQHLETGCLVGKVRRVLLPYAEKWQADLIVLGLGRGNRWLRRLLGETALDVLNKLSCGLYAAA